MSDEPTLSSKVLNFVLNFIKQETEALRHSLDNMNVVTPRPAEWHHIPPLLRFKIEGLPDRNHQLSHLLSYSPVLIPPSVYLHFFHEANAGATSQMLLLRRLVFHRRFVECWQIFSAITSLNDMDEFLDVVFEELAKNHHEQLGMYELLAAMDRTIHNQTLTTFIVESVCHRKSVLREDIDKFLEYERALPAQPTYDVSHPSPVYRAFAYRRWFPERPAEVGNALSGDTAVSRLPGVVAFVLNSSNTYLRDSSPAKLPMYIFQGRRLCLNDHDILAILPHASNDASLHILLRRSYQQLAHSPFIINHVVSHVRHIPTLASLAIHYSKLLSNETICDVMLRLGAEDLKKFMARLRGLPSTRASSLAQHLRAQPLTSEEVARLVPILNTFPFQQVVPHLLRQVTSQEHITSLAQLTLRAPSILELYRRHVAVGVDTTFVPTLFHKLLHACWKPEVILNRPCDHPAESVDPFHRLYRFATPTERANLHNHIRAFAQTTSLLPATSIAECLNSIHAFMQSPVYTFVSTAIGRDYILEGLVADVMRFAFRGCENPQDGIYKLRDILNSLSFNSKNAQSAVYRYMIRENPHQCISILHTYKDRKSFLRTTIMEAIMSGVLTSPKLPDLDKLALFKHFRQVHMDLGYKNSLKPRNVIELVNLLIRIHKADPSGSPESLRWILAYAKDKRVPRHIAEKWAQSLRIRWSK